MKIKLFISDYHRILQVETGMNEEAKVEPTSPVSALLLDTGQTNTEHEGASPSVGFQCQLCPRVFNRKYRLNEHVQSIHMGNLFKCDYCTKEFTTATGLANHTKAHTGNFKYCCEQCGAGFVYKPQFVAHVNRHNAVRAEKCEKCGKGFFSNANRSQHQ